jgi:hypothetical protein
MRKTLIGVLLAAAAVLGFSACGPATDHGDITAKRYSKAYTYWSSQCYSWNAQGQCTMSMPVQNSVPADYDIKVLDEMGTDAWLDVSAEEYGTLRVGDYYDAGEKNE